MISFGGATKAAQDAAYFRPFEQSGAARVVAGEYNGELSKVKAMVDIGQVSWDVVEVESPELLRGCEEGLFEPIDPALLGNAASFMPGTLSECGVASYVWSMVLAYDAGKLAAAPTSWADFWDLERFPGKRGLRKGAKYTLEAALLADGVKRENLYSVLATPEGVTRAFAKLDQIKPHIQWWEAGAQPPQWLAAGDVVMSAAYNGRIAAAQKEGSALAIVERQPLRPGPLGHRPRQPEQGAGRALHRLRQPGRDPEAVLQPDPLRAGAPGRPGAAARGHPGTTAHRAGEPRRGAAGGCGVLGQPRRGAGGTLQRLGGALSHGPPAPGEPCAGGAERRVHPSHQPAAPEPQADNKKIGRAS